MSSFQPPPTWALPILVDERTGLAVFNPVWLKWFVDLTAALPASGAGSVSSVSVVPANGLAGTVATSTTTPAITLRTTVTGLLKGNGTAISAAVSGTDYAPATSGTSILYGNGAGGFSNVTIGTGVAFAAGTLSATGSSGSVTSVTGTAPVASSGGTTPAISMAAATTSVNGYLTSTDWTTFNNKGSGTVTSVTGTAGRITSTGGTTPVIDLASGVATAGTTGSVSLIPVVTIDTYGRVTGITTAANPQGTVTSVTGTSPVASSGGATPAISMPAATTSVSGYLTSTDWTTFNNKGSGTVTSVTGTAPVVSSGGTTPALSMAAATASVNGYLTSTDWTTFNNKGSGTVTSVSGTAGRITSTGGATPVIDLVSGIATPGTTGSVSLIPVVTIDTYGRVTSITTAANPQGTVTSVSGTGTVNGITLTGTVTSSGSLTLGGTLSGTASGLTAGNVTTNANLTGPITSVGNATSVAAQTGTGSTFVMNTSPTLITPILGVAAATSINFGVSALTTYSESQSWTPNQGSGLTVVGAFSSSGTYTRVGNMITANGYVSGATSVAVAATGDLCSNLPVGAGGTTIFFGGAANNSISVFSQTLTSTQRLISLNAIGATTRIYFSVNYTV